MFHLYGVVIKFSIFLRFVVFSYFRRPKKHLLKFYSQMFVCSVTLASEIEQVLIYFNKELNAQFLYSITICMLHYNPRHVSSINIPIFRRTNYIITASGIVSLIRLTVQLFTESDDTRCCDNTICPPEDGHVDARNMSRVVM
jgi:hypothetical protein